MYDTLKKASVSFLSLGFFDKELSWASFKACLWRNAWSEKVNRLNFKKMLLYLYDIHTENDFLLK